MEEILFYPTDQEKEKSGPGNRPQTRRPSMQAAVNLMVDVEASLNKDAENIIGNNPQVNMPVLTQFFGVSPASSSMTGSSGTGSAGASTPVSVALSAAVTFVTASTSPSPTSVLSLSGKKSEGKEEVKGEGGEEEKREKMKKILRASEDLNKYLDDADVLDIRRDSNGRWADLEFAHSLIGMFFCISGHSFVRSFV